MMKHYELYMVLTMLLHRLGGEVKFTDEEIFEARQAWNNNRYGITWHELPATNETIVKVYEHGFR
jgi:hypothetical protein